MWKFFVSLGIVCALMLAYLGWTFYSRHRDNRSFAEQREKERAAQDQGFMEYYGDSSLRILSFYASPGRMRRGESAKLCYSVANSEKVRIEPPVDYVWPSYSRCVDVAPKKDTVYKLIAEDAAGNKKTAETFMQVR